jgi:hypothetical protein
MPFFALAISHIVGNQLLKAIGAIFEDPSDLG